MANFADSIQVVLRNEGGYVFDPDDPGGETKYGISKKAFPTLDIPSLTQKQAEEIYLKYYWNPNGLPRVKNQRIATAVLDAVVHHGRGDEVVQKALVRAGKPVSIDNVIGDETIRALNSVNPDNFLRAYVTERKNYMESLIAEEPKLAKYRKGWFKRVNFFNPGGISAGIGAGILILAGIAFFLLRRS